MSRNKWIVGGTLLLLMIGIPAVLFLSQQTQETRSRASASTTLSFTPSNTETSPLQKNTGEPVSLDVFVVPGGPNQVSQVKLEISYDPTKLIPADIPFIANIDAFPGTLDGPIVQDGKVSVVVTSTPDPSKTISQATKVGTVNFMAISSTSMPTQVSFGPGTHILSFAAEDMHDENVLSTTTPTFISINGSSITPPPVAPSTDAQGTRLDVKVILGGIEKNATPKRLTRNFELPIYNGQNELIASPKGSLTYNSTDGNFTGTISVAEDLSTGAYAVKIKSSGYLTRLIPGSLTITAGQVNILPPVSLAGGDTNKDNALNTTDYNLIQSCYGASKSATCTDEIQQLSDLNDDGSVDIIDLNVFLREVSTKTGD